MQKRNRQSEILRVVCECHKQTDKLTHTDRKIDRQTDRQTDRERKKTSELNRLTEKEKLIQRERERERSCKVEMLLLQSVNK